MNKSEWYVDWFNSPYYHLLYNHRNDAEAKFFIDNLCRFLSLHSNEKVWDLACGKGRHALVLNQNHLDVSGTDLSENNIAEALKSSKADLHFYVHDMRTAFKENYFSAVFNLFTSIGYFENFEDNFTVFKNVHASLKEGGYFVIDFFNAQKVVEGMQDAYIEERGEMRFHIRKKIENNSIVKRIEFNDAGKQMHFEESVSLLRKTDFEKFAAQSDFTLLQVFGNYNLEAFDEKNSDRLILIFKK